MHGFIHFWLTHAFVEGHSELTTHSGLQDGGEPWNPSRHAQTAVLSVDRHKLFGPQGDGWQGSCG